MGTEITTVEVFERALLLSVDERAQLVQQLLRSIDNERSSAEQISARFNSLGARFCNVVKGEPQSESDDPGEGEPFGGARLA